MVKEIRNAAELRENLLVSKVESLIEKCLNSNNMVSISFVMFMIYHCSYLPSGECLP